MESRYGRPGVPVPTILIDFQTQEDLIIEFLTRILQENTAETQTVICVGFTKLLLAGIITKPLVCIFGSLLRCVACLIRPFLPRYSKHWSFFTSPQKRRRIKNCDNA
jgi:hypothetical protein